MTIGSKTIRFISILLFFSMFLPTILFARPKEANAFWGIFDFGAHVNPVSDASAVTTGTNSVVQTGLETTQTSELLRKAAKEIWQQVQMAVARKLLQEMTKSTINWINSGFHGSPLFLENPDSFFRDVVKSEVRTIIDTYGYDTLRFPFGRSWALNTINAYKSQLENNAAYTYSGVFNDPVLETNYRIDFNTGGWDAFLVNTQYPQNTSIGFHMLANEELARRIQGGSQNAVQKVQSSLQEGLGFLSPKKCTTNKDYNNGYNEFKQPRFDIAKWESDYVKNNRPPSQGTPVSDELEGAPDTDYAIWKADHDEALGVARGEWNGKNTCPQKKDGSSGFESTTPGSVVAHQIIEATGSSFRQTELAAAVGNSLSAVFDALLNKLLSDGLNALASKINPPEKENEWTYGGLTLGGPGEAGTNFTWDSGPDEPVILEEFKQKVADGIADTEEELRLMYNAVPLRHNPTTGLVEDGPGLYQMLAEVWPKARELDICLPGPDVGWEDRVKEEVDRNTKKLQSLVSGGSSGGDAAKADEALKELNFAVKFFQDWIYNKMIMELPSSVLYLDAVKDVHILSQESNELTDAQRGKRQALVRLQAISRALDAFSSQPVAGSSEEKALISLWKQYKATLVDVSNSITIENTRDELSKTKDRYNNLNKLTKECVAERIAAGWGVPGGRTSSFSKAPVFTLPTDKDEKKKTENILNGLEPNTEQALFCNLPIATGYTHEMFLGPGTANPPLPMVNAEKVLPYKVMTIKSVIGNALSNLDPIRNGFSTSPKKQAYVNIQLSCNTIYQANILDYKGSLPGATNITVSPVELPDDTGEGNLGVCSFADDDDIIMSEEDCQANGGDWEQIARPEMPDIQN